MPLQDDGRRVTAHHSDEDEIARDCAPVVRRLNDDAVRLRHGERATDIEGVCEPTYELSPEAFVVSVTPPWSAFDFTAKIAEGTDQEFDDAPHRTAHTGVWDQH